MKNSLGLLYTVKSNNKFDKVSIKQIDPASKGITEQ